MTSKAQKKIPLFGDGATPRSMSENGPIPISGPSSLTGIRRAGLDPESDNYGLMAANLFPKQKKISFSADGFSFVLEKGRHPESLAVLSKGRTYEFVGKFKTSSKKTDQKKAWFLPVKSKPLLVTYNPTKITTKYHVADVAHQPPRATFFISLIPEEDVVL